MDTYAEQLRALGLTEREARTYVGLLEYSPVSIRRLAVITGINRGGVYESIKSLTGRGLVSFYMHGKRKYYFAESPEVLHDVIRNEKLALLAAEQKTKKAIPELHALYARTVNADPVMRFYDDDEGIKTILSDVLVTAEHLDPKQYYAYSSKANREYLYRKFPDFTKRRVDKSVFVKVISVGDKGDEPIECAERKWLPGSYDERHSSYTIIYGDKVAMIGVSGSDIPYGVVVEDASAARMQRLLFEELWHRLD